jgi:syntaxin-binding protein 1
MEEYPYIRAYQSGNLACLGEKLGKSLQKEVDHYSQLDSDFANLKNRPRSTIIILDRSFDMISPLIHEFTYQAMLNDLLALEGSKYVYLNST